MKKIVMIILGLMLMGVQCLAGDGSLERVRKEGKLIIGLDDTFAPMGFRDEKGEIVGFDIDLAKEVSKRIGVEPVFLPCEWDGILLSLNSKKIDLIWNGLTITDDRKKQISFSKPYFTGDQIIITTPEKGIKKIADIEGKILGIQMGSASYFALEKAINKNKIKIKEIKNYPENASALLDLQAGRIDAVVIDSMTGNYYATKENKKIGKDVFVSVDEVLTEEKEEIGVGIRKVDVELREMIDKTLEDMKADGSFDTIYKKWFGGKNK